MSERPIVMTAESVRAILEGRKTQTRRVVKPQPDAVSACGAVCKYKTITVLRDHDFVTIAHPEGRPEARFVDVIKPPCQPGDILWVRERFYRFTGSSRWAPPSEYRYFADDPVDENDYGEASIWLPRSPRFMPRKAARLFLLVTAVRCERLQDIGLAGCLAEGLDEKVEGYSLSVCQLRGRYRDLWDTLNAKRGYPWADNPWVWVYEFTFGGVRK